MGNCLCVESKAKSKPPVSPNSSKPLPLNRRPAINSALVKDISDDYTFIEILGQGHFGIVRKAINKHDSNLIVAVKSINKQKLKKEIHLLKREVESLSALDHPNIIKLYESYEDLKYFHIVTEYCSGGMLLDRVVNTGHYSEREAANLMYKILLTVNHLHSKGICHRDLKPDNFVFENHSKDAELKLIDFGLATKFGTKFHKMDSIVGTPHYVAPEILKGEYSFECDLWSVGVIMFKLLSGSHPFTSEHPRGLLHSLLNGKLKFRGDVWKVVSKQAKKLIKKLLDRNPSARYTAEMALEHPWFDSAITGSKISLDQEILQSLKNFRATSKIQQEAYAVLVKYLSLNQIKDLRKAFRALDSGKTGYLSFNDIRKAIDRYGLELENEKLEEILNNTNFHNDGHINYSEFLAATLSSRVAIDEELIWRVFKKFDLSRSGHITPEDLKEVLRRLGEDFTDEQVKQMLSEVELNEEGLLSFEEFKKLFKLSESHTEESDSVKFSSDSQIDEHIPKNSRAYPKEKKSKTSERHHLTKI